MNRYENYRILAGRIRMHLYDWPGAEPTVFFLHSFTANGLAALPLSTLLDGHNRLIAPDLRGRGKSDMPFGEYGLNVHVKDVLACLDRLELDNCIVAGHSFGATIGTLLAARYPERVLGLILFDGGAAPTRPVFDRLSAYYDNLQYKYVSAEQYIEPYRHAPLYQPFTPDLEALLHSNLYPQPDNTFIRQVPRYVVNADRRIEDFELSSTLPDLYEKIRCPVLIVRAGMGITGPDDQVLADDVVAPMLGKLANAHLITLPQAGHTSLLTAPNAERDEALLDFISRI